MDDNKNKNESFKRVVQYLHKRPLSESEKLLRFNLSLRGNKFYSREWLLQSTRNAIWMLRLHRAVLSATPEELARYEIQD